MKSKGQGGREGGCKVSMSLIAAVKKMTRILKTFSYLVSTNIRGALDHKGDYYCKSLSDIIFFEKSKVYVCYM